MFELVDERCVAPILVNICHRIRPAFEHKSGEIRAASIQLFGTLHRFGHAEGSVIFNEQLHNNLPSLYLHIFDPDSSVEKVLPHCCSSHVVRPLFGRATNGFIGIQDRSEAPGDLVAR